VARGLTGSPDESCKRRRQPNPATRESGAA
jgi:hypothetical protein